MTERPQPHIPRPMFMSPPPWYPLHACPVYKDEYIMWQGLRIHCEQFGASNGMIVRRASTDRERRHRSEFLMRKNEAAWDDCIVGKYFRDGHAEYDKETGADTLAEFKEREGRA